MRTHDDLRAQAEKELGQPVSSFTTEGVIEAKLVFGDCSATIHAPAGTSVEEMFNQAMAVARRGLKDQK